MSAVIGEKQNVSNTWLYRKDPPPSYTAGIAVVLGKE